MSSPRAKMGGMSRAHEIVRTGMPLGEFFRRFPDDAAAERWFESRRWPDGPECPHCGAVSISTGTSSSIRSATTGEGGTSWTG